MDPRRLSSVNVVADWIVVLVAVATPVLAFSGAFIGHVMSRRTAVENDLWRRREERLRTMRWAAEQAVSSDQATAVLGVATLEALRFSELLQPVDIALVDAVTVAVQGGILDELDDPDTQPVEFR